MTRPALSGFDAAMPRALPPFVLTERSRHGRVTFYFRRGKGKRTRLPDDPASPEFAAVYAACLTGQEPPKPGAPAHGSLRWLVAAHMESRTWVELAPATRKQRGLFLQQAVERAGDRRANDVTRTVIEAGVAERTSRPALARNWLQAMNALFRWAVQAGHLPANPAEGVRPPRYRTDGFAAWTVEDALAFRAHWPVGSKPRLAFELFLCAGFRRGDMHRLGPQHRKGGMVSLRTAKRGVPVTVRLTAEAEAALAATPTGDMAFMTREDGRPFTSKESFGNWFSARCREAGLARGKSAHGIRKLAATLAANAGSSTHQLMSHFGWQTTQQAEIYTRGADRERLGLESSARLADEIGNIKPRTGS